MKDKQITQSYSHSLDSTNSTAYSINIQYIYTVMLYSHLHPPDTYIHTQYIIFLYTEENIYRDIYTQYIKYVNVFLVYTCGLYGKTVVTV